jgi:hypothetical protein
LLLFNKKLGEALGRKTVAWPFMFAQRRNGTNRGGSASSSETSGAVLASEVFKVFLNSNEEDSLASPSPRCRTGSYNVKSSVECRT